MSLTSESFQVGMTVRYVPFHADGNAEHPDCEVGVVTSIRNDTGTVFVRFGTRLGSQGCSADQLEIEAA